MKVIISKHELTRNITKNIAPSFIENVSPTDNIEGSDLRIINVTKDNEDYLRGYKKFTEEEVEVIINSGLIPFNKNQDNIVLEAFPSKLLADGRRLYEQTIGIKKDCIIGNNTIVFEIPYLCKFNEIEFLNTILGERLDFYIELKESDEPLFRHGVGSYLPNGKYTKTGRYDAELSKDMQLRMEYISKESATKFFNITLHMIVSANKKESETVEL